MLSLKYLPQLWELSACNLKYLSSWFWAYLVFTLPDAGHVGHFIASYRYLLAGALRSLPVYSLQPVALTRSC